MKKKNKLILTIILVLTCAIFSINIIKADSGWDTSYDKSSSNSSSSSSSSSNDYNSSSDYSSSASSYSSSNSSSSNSNLGGGDFVYVVIALSILFGVSLIYVLMYKIFKKTIPRISNKLENKENEKRLNKLRNNIYVDKDSGLLKMFDINYDEFLKEAYENYVKIQNAWMDFDYDSLKELLTDELYNTYYSQLEALKVKKEKNIMSNFKLKDIKIKRLFDENNIVGVVVYLRVKMKDYVVDKNNKVVRGSKFFKLDVEYLITYVKPKDIKEEMVCPNCGAPLEDTTRGECTYCRTLIVRPSKKYVMSKKTCTNQRRTL